MAPVISTESVNARENLCFGGTQDFRFADFVGPISVTRSFENLGVPPSRVRKSCVFLDFHTPDSGGPHDFYFLVSLKRFLKMHDSWGPRLGKDLATAQELSEGSGEAVNEDARSIGPACIE